MSSPLDPADRWLVAIDIDGTLVHDDGYLSPRVAQRVRETVEAGHVVVVATGRSAANAIPVIKDIGLTAGHVVCSNGAVTVEIDPVDPQGYRPLEVITFDPKDVLSRLIDSLPSAHFAVEDIDGTYRFHRPFPTYALGNQNVETPLHELMEHPVSRVVVLSPEHDVEEFLGLITQIGLHSVSYAIGYTAWLDIAPEGVTKASGLAKLRQRHGVAPQNVVVMGDGRNDIPMFEWAKTSGGISFAMGQGPEEVLAAADEITASVEDDGVAQVLEALEGIRFARRND